MKELTTTNESAILSIIEKVALDPNVNTEKMQQIIDMQMQIHDKNAQIEYNKSMVQCQSKMPKVVTNKVNKQTSSTYADLSTVLVTVKPVYTKYGFALSFGNKKAEKADHVCVTCEVMHKSGYTKYHEVEWPIDDKGIQGKTNKTPIHGMASTNSYAQRYLTCRIFNIAVGDHDNDGNGCDSPTLTESQVCDLHALIIEVGADEDKFCKYMNVSSLSEILNENYQRAVKVVESKR
jgi:hypothetical protein